MNRDYPTHIDNVYWDSMVRVYYDKSTDIYLPDDEAINLGLRPPATIEKVLAEGISSDYFRTTEE